MTFTIEVKGDIDIPALYDATGVQCVEPDHEIMRLYIDSVISSEMDYDAIGTTCEVICNPSDVFGSDYTADGRRILDKPLTNEEIQDLLDETGYVSGVIRFDLGDIIHGDIETFNDKITDKLIASGTLGDISWEIVGHDTCVLLLSVRANFHDDENQLLKSTAEIPTESIPVEANIHGGGHHE